jgi:hypothetical protein
VFSLIFFVRIRLHDFQSPTFGKFANGFHLVADGPILGLPGVGSRAGLWKFLPHTKKVIRRSCEIKIAAFRSLIVKSGTPEMGRSALKHDSGTLFIDAEIFPSVAFQENT